MGTLLVLSLQLLSLKSGFAREKESILTNTIKKLAKVIQKSSNILTNLTLSYKKMSSVIQCGCIMTVIIPVQ